MVNFSSQHSSSYHPSPSVTWQAAVWVPEQLTNRSQGGQKGSCLSASRICALIAPSDHIGAKRQAAIVPASSPSVSTPHPQWMWLSQDLVGVFHTSLPFIFLPLHPFGKQILKTRTLKKQLHLQRKLEGNSACPGKGSEDTWEGLKFTP